MHVIQGSGVGGGSLHYFNVHLRPPAAIFDDPRWPSQIDFEVLEPYYALARGMFDATPLAPPRGRDLPTRTTTFQEACELAGHAPHLVDIAVYTGPGRRNPHGAVPQLPCDYSGNCGIGCAPHAKNTLDLTYLPLAERHEAEVFPLCKVDKIEPLSGGAYRVSFARLDPDAPRKARLGSVDATNVIVAAGTLGTNELLLRCRDWHGTLPRLSSVLGRGFRQRRSAARRDADQARHRRRTRAEHYRRRRCLNARTARVRRGPWVSRPRAVVRGGYAGERYPHPQPVPVGQALVP